MISVHSDVTTACFLLVLRLEEGSTVLGSYIIVWDRGNNPIRRNNCEFTGIGWNNERRDGERPRTGNSEVTVVDLSKDQLSKFASTLTGK